MHETHSRATVAPAGGYIVAKANQTAVPFVARAERERDGWIVLGRFPTYREALSALAGAR